MTEYLHRSRTQTRTLEPGQDVELWFDPGGSGTVQIDATVLPNAHPHPHAGPNPGPLAVPEPQPTICKLELFQASHAPPVATLTRTGVSAQLTRAAPASATAGKQSWLYRLTNLGEHGATFHAAVSFPTDIEIRTADISLDAFHQLTGGTIHALALHLHSGSGEPCRLDFTNQYVRDMLATKGVTLPVRFALPALAGAAIRDINNTSAELTAVPATAQRPRGALHLALRFEEQGREIILDGLPDIELSNMKLDVHLALAARDGLVSWDRVDVDFPVTADLHKFPDFLITLFVNVTQRVRDGVQDALAQMLSGARREAISTVVTAVVKGLTGVPPGATIHGVKVTTNRIVLTYFED